MEKERFEHVIPSLAVCSASLVCDCARHVTGTLAPLGYLAQLLSQGIVIAWTACDAQKKYKGGYVMLSIKRLYDNILVCDFSSMYSTFITSCNVNVYPFSRRRRLRPLGRRRDS